MNRVHINCFKHKLSVPAGGLNSIKINCWIRKKSNHLKYLFKYLLLLHIEITTVTAATSF